MKRRLGFIKDHLIKTFLVIIGIDVLFEVLLELIDETTSFSLLGLLLVPTPSVWWLIVAAFVVGLFLLRAWQRSKSPALVS